MNKTLISLLLALGYPAHAEENILDAEAAIKNGAPLAAVFRLQNASYLFKRRKGFFKR